MSKMPPGYDGVFQQKKTAAEDRLLSRYRAARDRLIAWADRTAHREALIFGAVSPFAKLAEMVRPGADVWLPQHLVARREELRQFMLTEVPPIPDPRTGRAVDRLIGAVASGLAWIGDAGTQGDLAVALTQLIASQMIPFPEGT